MKREYYFDKYIYTVDREHCFPSEHMFTVTNDVYCCLGNSAYLFGKDIQVQHYIKCYVRNKLLSLVRISYGTTSLSRTYRVSVETTYAKYEKKVEISVFEDKTSGEVEKVKKIIMQYSRLLKYAMFQDIDGDEYVMLKKYMQFHNIYMNNYKCQEYLPYNIAKKIMGSLGSDILKKVCKAIKNAYDEGYQSCSDEYEYDYDW